MKNTTVKALSGLVLSLIAASMLGCGGKKDLSKEAEETAKEICGCYAKSIVSDQEDYLACHEAAMTKAESIRKANSGEALDSFNVKLTRAVSACTSSQASSLSPVGPIRMNGVDFVREFYENEQAADAKYGSGEVVEVTMLVRNTEAGGIVHGVIAEMIGSGSGKPVSYPVVYSPLFAGWLGQRSDGGNVVVDYTGLHGSFTFKLGKDDFARVKPRQELGDARDKYQQWITVRGRLKNSVSKRRTRFDANLGAVTTDELTVHLKDAELVKVEATGLK